MKIDYYTTSISFNPNHISERQGWYHHKNLNPSKKKWGKNTLLLVRNSNGIDYIIKFIENGYPIPKDATDYDKLKRWKYCARFDVIKEMEKNKTKARTITKALKTQVLENQKGCCGFCGDSVGDKNPYEIDHIFEWSCGGRTELKNLRALCKDSCHWIKTAAFRKAKMEGKINSEHWQLNDQKTDFLMLLVNKIRLNSKN
jgi:hypothetical protein